LMIAHFVQWRLMGTTVSPIEPSESMFTLQNGLVNAGFIFFSLAILATLILGRFVCGWGCHIVALQDLCAWVLKKFGLTPKPFRSRLLVFVPLIVALYMFVWPTVSRLFAAAPNEKVIPQFTNHIITTEFWATFPTVAVAIPFLFICGFMTVVFLGSKGFCTYGCPYGGFFGVAERVAPGRIRVTDACNQCGHCTATCTSNVIVHAEVKQYGMVVDPGCMKCMDCISVCPNDALYFGFGKPAVVVPERKAKKNFSLTWPEEFLAAFVFFASLMAVWDVYQLVPMLMALGIAGVTTFLAISLFKLLRDESMFFYGFTLRSAGKIKTAGLAFLVFSALWIGLNIHSGYVSYHERAGAIAYENIRIPDELALAGTDPKQWLSPTEQKNIAAAKTHFADASSVGLFINKEALSKQAWVEYLAGNTDRALELLGSAAENQSGQGRALSLYYRGAILNRIGRFQDALAGLEAALNETPDLIVANEEKGESLWQLGRRDEAVAVWSETVKRNPNLPLANNFLAGAAEISGDSNAAAAYQNQADRTTPRDPYFHRMLGLRLNNLGMDSAAERHFQTAIKLDPSFRSHSKGR
ncbi:MAG: tetratricopeptide repeat protein, partial [Pyrinomonadaceae bacterium]